MEYPTTMKIKITYSLLGLVVGILVALLVGAGTSSNEINRFRVSCGAGFAIMTDTKTGQAWIYSSVGTGYKIDGNFFDAK